MGPPAAGVPVAGTIRVPDVTDYRRNHFFGLTGTYYDKDLTDIVYRYDVLYAPKVGVYIAGQSATARWRQASGPTERNGPK